MYNDQEDLRSLFLHKICLENFRGFEDTVIEFDPKLTVIAGINGAGKTSLLEAIAIGLHRVAARIQNEKAIGRGIQEKDIRIGFSRSKLEFEMTLNQSLIISWETSRYRPFTKRSLFDKEPEDKNDSKRFIGINDFVGNVHESLENLKGVFPIPVFSLYGANRATLDIPLRIRKKHDFYVTEANESALETGATSFRTFFEWFRRREDLENEVRIERLNEGRSDKYRDNQLEAVRDVVEDFLSFNDLRVKRSPLRMVLKKKESNYEFTVNQLSDGEKGILALFGDLARRLAIANPQEESPLKSKAIVLIDEIDLHLHPRWQREVIQKLPKLFPNCQFILTTHSPQVLGEAEASQIRLLRTGQQGIEVQQPNFSKGLTSNLVLEEIMDTNSRNRETMDLISEIEKLISIDRYDSARVKLKILAEKLGESESKVVELNSLLNFLTN